MPDPLVIPWDAELEDDEVVRFGKPRAKDRRLPVDFYVRELREVDVTDTDALLAFLRTYGRVGWPIELPLLLSPSLGAPPDEYCATLEEIREHILVLRKTTDIWMGAKRGQVEADDANYLMRVLNTGMGNFSPFVWAPGYAEAASQIGSAFPPSAYAAACMQLFNDIAARAVYRRCQNSSCKRIFVRQRGRSEYDQYRMRGVKYCSNLCARAKAQRDYRRRQGRND